MSGIAAIIHFDGAPVAAGGIERMTSSMAFRGPDGTTHWRDGAVALGHCMLRTTPESLEETQPLANEDRSAVLVLDGWVSNWTELRGELVERGVRPRTRSDAELVLRAYETWGEDCVAHIDGDFAFVIWDARRRAAFCGRDRIGNKPLYCRWSNGRLVVASEIHALLTALADPPRLNHGMIAEFLGCEWMSRTETFWQGVDRLVAAHVMTASSNGLQQRRYWSPGGKMVVPCKSEPECEEYYRELLFDEVRRASRSFAPLACEVSGGLDSSAVFVVADALARRGSLLAPALEGYTMAFDDDSEANEMVYARAVGSHVGRHIAEITPTGLDLDDYRRHARSYRCFPSYPNGTVTNTLRETAAARGSRALLVGIGGDEWLGGSRSHYTDAVRERDWRGLRTSIAADARAAGWGSAAAWTARHGVYPLLPLRLRLLARRVAGRPLTGPDRSTWLSAEMKATLDEQMRKSRAVPESGTGSVQHRELFDILEEAYSTHARELEDQLAALRGVELRKPLYTARMVDFAFATPGSLRLRGHTNRFLHRQAMRGLLPELVRTRPGKANFMTTFSWSMPGVGALLQQDWAERAGRWVSCDRIPGFLAAAARQEDHGWPEMLLWNLFACLAIEESVSPGR